MEYDYQALNFQRELSVRCKRVASNDRFQRGNAFSIGRRVNLDTFERLYQVPVAIE